MPREVARHEGVEAGAARAGSRRRRGRARRERRAPAACKAAASSAGSALAARGLRWKRSSTSCSQLPQSRFSTRPRVSSAAFRRSIALGEEAVGAGAEGLAAPSPRGGAGNESGRDRRGAAHRCRRHARSWSADRSTARSASPCGRQREAKLLDERAAAPATRRRRGRRRSKVSGATRSSWAKASRSRRCRSCGEAMPASAGGLARQQALGHGPGAEARVAAGQDDGGEGAQHRSRERRDVRHRRRRAVASGETLGSGRKVALLEDLVAPARELGQAQRKIRQREPGARRALRARDRAAAPAAGPCPPRRRPGASRPPLARSASSVAASHSASGADARPCNGRSTATASSRRRSATASCRGTVARPATRETAGAADAGFERGDGVPAWRPQRRAALQPVEQRIVAGIVPGACSRAMTPAAARVVDNRQPVSSTTCAPLRARAARGPGAPAAGRGATSATGRRPAESSASTWRRGRLRLVLEAVAEHRATGRGRDAGQSNSASSGGSSDER